MYPVGRSVARMGAFRSTPVRHFGIPPWALRIVSSVVISMAEQFVAQHMSEAKRMREAQAQNGGFDPAADRATHGPSMSHEEALKILDLNTNLAVPLRGTKDRLQAKENFERLFSKAEKSSVPYLQGKISKAYRLCCDDSWDKKER